MFPTSSSSLFYSPQHALGFHFGGSKRYLIYHERLVVSHAREGGAVYFDDGVAGTKAGPLGHGSFFYAGNVHADACKSRSYSRLVNNSHAGLLTGLTSAFNANAEPVGSIGLDVPLNSHRPCHH